jgi:ATP-binding cassette subfamily B protein RaxB
MADGATHTARTRSPLEGLQWGWRRRLPMMLQTEAAECGLACLAMIGRYYGHDVDLAGLRGRFPTSLKGVNLARVMAMATALDFTTRPVRLELEELGDLRTPCILHWDLNHFVVLKGVRGRHVVIHDPAHGERKLTFNEVSDHFTGVALELTPAADFKPVEARQKISLKALTGKVRGLAPAMVHILLLALVLEVFALVGPFYMQLVLDQAVVSADRGLLMLLGIGFFAVMTFQTLISSAQSWVVTRFGTVLNLQWVNNLFRHMLKVPMRWYETRHVGDIVSRFGSVGAIQDALTTDFIGSLLDGLMSVITLAVLFLYSVKLTLLVLALFTAYLLIRLISFRPFYRLNEEQIVCSAKQETEMLETIRGALPIKLGNKQSERSARYANAMVETSNRSLAMQRFSILFGGLNGWLSGAGHVALIWLAALMVLNGQFTVGMLVAFVSYAGQFTGRAGSLVDYAMKLRMLKLHAERIADIALAEPEKHTEPQWQGPSPEVSLELRHVSFRYDDDAPWVLKDCSLRLEAGESVAIVGPSGCGKTTLAKLMLGLLAPAEGDILYGGVDIRQLGLYRYRRQIGAVMQDDQLFAGSIAENISFFDPAASQDAIQIAARMAAIDADIRAMPMGYESLVGDMGSALSGGQKQRVILARALYRKPSVLVLDEATSHLDPTSEMHINAFITQMAATRLIIAHRQETVAKADRILRCENGIVQPVHLGGEATRYDEGRTPGRPTIPGTHVRSTDHA